MLSIYRLSMHTGKRVVHHAHFHSVPLSTQINTVVIETTSRIIFGSRGTGRRTIHYFQQEPFDEPIVQIVTGSYSLDNRQPR